MKHAPLAVIAASIATLALASVAGCDRPDAPRTVVVEKPVVVREKTVVIREDRDHVDHQDDRMGGHPGEPHGPPPVGDRR